MHIQSIFVVGLNFRRKFQLQALILGLLEPAASMEFRKFQITAVNRQI